MEESWGSINQLLIKRSKLTKIDSLKDSCHVGVDKQGISNEMSRRKLPADIDIASKQFLLGERCPKTMAKIKIKKSFGNDNVS